MKTLDKIILHGSQFGKHTGYHTWPGFVMLHFTDQSTKYCGDISHNEALAQAKQLGVDCSEYERKAAEWEKAHSYPPKPESAELYQHNYGYQKPTALGEWQWSTTFGRWGRIVTFADGWNGLTWPKTF